MFIVYKLPQDTLTLNITENDLPDFSIYSRIKLADKEEIIAPEVIGVNILSLALGFKVGQSSHLTVNTAYQEEVVDVFVLPSGLDAWAFCKFGDTVYLGYSGGYAGFYQQYLGLEELTNSTWESLLGVSLPRTSDKVKLIRSVEADYLNHAILTVLPTVYTNHVEHIINSKDLRSGIIEGLEFLSLAEHSAYSERVIQTLSNLGFDSKVLLGLSYNTDRSIQTLVGKLF